MSDWVTHKLGELCTEVTVGFVGKMSDQYVDAGVPFLRSQDINPGYIETGNLKFISPEFHQRIRKSRLSPGDVAIVRTGYPGTAAVVPNYLPIANCADLVIARPGPGLDPRYLAFVLNSPWGKGQVNNRLVGAAQQHFNVTVAKALEIPLPSLPIQRRIASILGAYDDLIEVNRRRIAVLEEMTRGLFEEWFVRFRFPGHEAAMIKDTPNGPLPQGWSWEPIGDVSAYVNRGIPPKYDEDAETLVISQKCIRNQRLSLALARKQSKNAPPDKVVRAGDILINSTGTGTLGRVAQAEDVPLGLTVDSHVTIVRPMSPEDRYFLGLSLFRMQPVFEHLGTGSTTQTELSRSAVQSQTLIWPPVDLRARFGRTIRPMRQAVEQLTQQNNNLAASRDLLLPRLISGQLSVAQAERELEAA